MTADEIMQATGSLRDKAALYAPFINAAMAEFDINTPARQAAFLAQCGHESCGLLFMRELWGPTPAQVRYEPPCSKAAELGNTQRGDGRRYLGRGAIQITGRANYRACGAALGADLEKFPDLLEQPGMAWRASAWWWKTHGCNELADARQFVALTKRINGGTIGLDDRLKRWEIAKAVTGDIVA